MNWLRLPGIEAAIPTLIHDDNGNLTDVTIDCRATAAYNICCLAQKLVSNGTKAVRYRDRRIEPAPTWLIFRRQRKRCLSCGATLYQAIPGMDDRHRMTARFRQDIILSSINRTFADVVRFHAVEETLVRRIFREHADRELLQYRYDAPRVLGIDENHLLGGARGVICDVERGELLDVLPGRTGSDIRRGLDRMNSWGTVEVWCQDMAGAYKGIARDLFPKASIVVDKFHVLSKANYWWSRVRLAETAKLPKEAREQMPGLIRVFDRHWEVMTPRQQDRVAEILAHSPRMQTAWTIKESFYYFYDAQTRSEAEDAYTNWVQLAKAQHAEWKPLMTMMARWRKEIFNFFDHRFTSAKVERMNRSIGDINRASNGLDFQTLRAKAILRHGRITPKASLSYYSLRPPSTRNAA
ncbi:MAG TPA: ISL3 family transposase [Sphingobium sp.]